MQDIKPILSIIVITYNQLNFLKETIASIVQQETNYFYELIVADDCSSDGTQAYCESIACTERYDFKYVRMEKNGGITANCNLGLSHAVGKYVTIIGGDDLFLPTKIQTHVDFMEQHSDVVISYHPVDIFDSASDATLLLTNQTRVDTPLNVLEIIKLCIPGSVSVMVRASALPVGGFDSRLPVVSDWLYYIEIAAKGKVGFFNKTLARYRKHRNQASARTYTLLDESLRNLDLAREKLPGLPGIDGAIAHGKSRYILGEAYRQFVSGDKLKTRALVDRALTHRQSISGYGLLLASYLWPSAIGVGSLKRVLKKIF